MARPRKNADASRASLLPESAPLPEIPVREQPYPLPEGWKWVRLGDVTQIASGGTPSSKTKEFYDNGNIPWLSPADLSNYNAVYISHGKKMLTPLGLKNSSARLLPSNTVCLSSRAPIGYVVIAQNPLCTNQGFKNFLPSHLYIPRFLYWYLKGSKPLLESYASGTTFLELSATKVARIPFPLPPREEQERIVGHIESLFARLDEARQKAEAVRDSVALRRAAILHKAFTGELTAKWREEQGISKESWKKKDFAHIITNIEAGKNVRCEERPPRENEAGIIKVSAVTWGFFNEMESKTCPDPSLYNENIQIKKGDFLFSRANTLQLVGNCVIVENITKKLMLSDKILRFSLDECTLKNYLLFFSLSDQYRSQIENAASGNQDGMRNISQKKLLGLTIPLPTLPEQREIVRLLDDLLGRERRIGEAADAVVAHIERMKKAILARAFRGELGRADRPSRA
ncbi:restriction endonuclease subunit S [uncultured Desulfovibrio sp.]|uniref:restriction endonuclease subunit S n=2 Tax=uncultured Desulfovibrio sp. TaxID=167968 RepID=UPI0025DF787B|nr:restriction endonuclease subunit S [uncultured Desulfovibrio sp.]